MPVGRRASCRRRARPRRGTLRRRRSRAGSRITSSPVEARDLDRAAALEAQLEVAHDVAGERERLRRADGALGAAAVGRREDLLGRHVRARARRPLDVRPSAEHPARLGQQADRQVGAGPAVAERVEARARSSASRPRGQPLDVLAPGGDRVGLVEPDRCRDRLPQPLDVRLAEDRPRPALVRERRRSSSCDGARSALAIARPTSRIRARRRASPSRSAKQLGLRVAGDRDQRAAVVARARQLLTSQGGESSRAPRPGRAR